MDFDGFLRMLKVGSVDSLDQYDARWESLYGSRGSIERLQSLLDASMHGSDNGSRHGGGSSHGRGRNARFGYGVASPAAAEAATGRKPWEGAPANFNFDFGSAVGVGKRGDKPPETQGAPEGYFDRAVSAPVAVAAVAAAGGGGGSGGGGQDDRAASYFNNGAVRGGVQFDKRMHGASLYHNAMLGGPGRNGPPGVGNGIKKAVGVGGRR